MLLRVEPEQPAECPPTPRENRHLSEHLPKSSTPKFDVSETSELQTLTVPTCYEGTAFLESPTSEPISGRATPASKALLKLLRSNSRHHRVSEKLPCRNFLA